MDTPIKKNVVIVSPALAEANNGNWQTARRWQQALSSFCTVRIVRQWPDGPAAQDDDCMLALHALRSAESIAAWGLARGRAGAAAPARGLAVVLTGTDLYGYIHTSPIVQQSMQWAQRLVVLQGRGPTQFPPALRERVRVILQSTTARMPLAKPADQLRIVMVGHLREEKSPQTLFDAARLIAPDERIFIDHIGEPLDVALGSQAQATARACPHYRWLGGLPHADARRHIQRAHVLVHASRIEGGAHVVMEAVCSGTPVLASRIDGNVGMLGDDYAGYFEWNNAGQLVQMLRQLRAENTLYAQLQAQCTLRAPLFSPQREQSALVQLVHELTDSAKVVHFENARPSCV